MLAKNIKQDARLPTRTYHADPSAMSHLNTPSSALFISASALSGLLAVALGAFGAHGLKHYLSPEKLAIFHTATQYQMYHALALLGVGVLIRLSPATKTLKISGLAFILGTVLFCGSLYALALGAPTVTGIITPFGGISFLAGWWWLLLSARRI